MPLTRVDRTVALLINLSRADIEALPPLERRRLAEQCKRIVDMAEPKPKPQGVLGDLGNGARAD
jgi:hypothetical protein